MKILVSAYSCDPTRGGEFGNGWLYASNKNELYNITCITTSEGKFGIAEAMNGDAYPTLKIIYVDTPAWLLKWKEKSNLVGLYFHYVIWQHLAYKKAKKMNSEINFDIVHHATYASLQLGSFMWKLKKPMLFGPVGGGQKAPPQFKKYFYGWWKLEKMRDFISFLLLDVFKLSYNTLRNAEITLVNNKDTYDMAKKYQANRIEYAPCVTLSNDFFPAQFKIRPNGKRMKMLWVGRIMPRKGLRIVLEAFAKVRKDLPIDLIIIGDGILGKLVPDWIEELELQNRVEWKGLLPLTSVQKEYEAADLFIYCSLRESLPAQLIEAMSFGLPSITLNLHGARTFVHDHVAYKIDVVSTNETIDRIKEAIEFFYFKPEKRIEIGEKAFYHAKEFTWAKKQEIVENCYKELYLAKEKTPV